MKIATVLVAAVAACSASADVLFDTRPSLSNGQGWTIGSDLDFTLHQPFTVSDAGGWNLTRIWLDGFRVSNSGTMNVDIAETTNGPSLASTQISISNTDANTSAFVSGDLNVNLTGGASYVMRISPANDGVWTALYFGSSGPDSTSYAGNGEVYDHVSVSTYFEGRPIPAPASLGLLSLAGLASGRRRR